MLRASVRALCEALKESIRFIIENPLENNRGKVWKEPFEEQTT
jgi:hypothetical protein